MLHIDDDPDQLYFSKIFLEEADPCLTVVGASTADDGLRWLRAQHFDVVLADFWMPGVDGIKLCNMVKALGPYPYIIYTGLDIKRLEEQARSVGADDFLRKEMNPIHYQYLARRLREAVETKIIPLNQRSLQDLYKFLDDLMRFGAHHPKEPNERFPPEHPITKLEISRVELNIAHLQGTITKKRKDELETTLNRLFDELLLLNCATN